MSLRLMKTTAGLLHEVNVFFCRSSWWCFQRESPDGATANAGATLRLWVHIVVVMR